MNPKDEPDQYCVPPEIYVLLAAAAADQEAILRRTLEAAGLRVESVRPVTASLEEVFIARLGEERS